MPVRRDLTPSPRSRTTPPPGGGGRPCRQGCDDWEAGVVHMYEVAARAAVRRGLPAATVARRFGDALDPRLPSGLRERIRRSVSRAAEAGVPTAPTAGAH